MLSCARTRRATAILRALVARVRRPAPLHDAADGDAALSDFAAAWAPLREAGTHVQALWDALAAEEEALACSASPLTRTVNAAGDVTWWRADFEFTSHYVAQARMSKLRMHLTECTKQPNLFPFITKETPARDVFVPDTLHWRIDSIGGQLADIVIAGLTRVKPRLNADAALVARTHDEVTAFLKSSLAAVRKSMGTKAKAEAEQLGYNMQPDIDGVVGERKGMMGYTGTSCTTLTKRTDELLQLPAMIALSESLGDFEGKPLSRHGCAVSRRSRSSSARRTSYGPSSWSSLRQHASSTSASSATNASGPSATQRTTSTIMYCHIMPALERYKTLQPFACQRTESGNSQINDIRERNDCHGGCGIAETIALMMTLSLKQCDEVLRP